MQPRKSWSDGAKKALKAMQDQYGDERGTRIFYSHVNKVAAPSVKKLPLNARVSKTFATGNQQMPGKGGTRKPKKAK